jgi:DNA-binding MarR family transcriptional regulator
MTVSKALKRLVAEGYVTRSEHKKDTRVKAIALTKKGRELTSKLVPIIEKVDASFFGTIRKNDQHTLISILRNLVSQVED